MKNASKIFFALAFMVTALLTVGSLIAGNEETAERFGVSAIISVAGFGMASVTPSGVFGFQWTREEETLLNHLAGTGNTQVFDDFNKGKLRFVDKVLYRAALVDGASGIYKLWDNLVDKAIGISNVDNAKLDKDTIVCVGGILIEYANSGGAGVDPAAIAGYDSVVTAWPAGLVNSELTILQDGNPLVESLPTSFCGSAADSFFAKGAADAYKLKNPFILEGDKRFEVRLELPAAIAAANTDFIKISLFGVGTRKRGLV